MYVCMNQKACVRGAAAQQQIPMIPPTGSLVEIMKS